MSLRRSRTALPLAVASILLVPLGAVAVAAPTHGSVAAIRSVSPRVERAGRTAVITGTGFRHVRAVRFHGEAAHFRVVSSHQIRAKVPAKATSGRVTVNTAAGTLTSRKPLRVAPTLTSFTPTSGGVHTVVTFTGTGFTTPASVSFNGTSTTGTVVSPTSITASLPLAATTGPVKLTTAGSTLTGATFTVTTGLALSTTVGPPTSSTTVYGSGFGSRELVDLYYGLTDVAVVATSGTGTFTYNGFTVPAAAQPGAGWISAQGRHSGDGAQTPFTVRTDWTQLGGGANRSGVNSKENTLSTSTVADLDTKWTFATHSYCEASPVVVGGVVYSDDAGGNVYAVNATTGAQIWTRNFGGSIPGSPAVLGTTLYIGTTSGVFYALNTANGSTRWTYTTGGAIYSSPAVVNGIIYFGSDDQKLYAVNASSGALVWSTPTDGFVFAPPAVANGRVFVGSSGGTFYAVDATTGTVDWSAPSDGGEITGGASVVAGTVYFGSGDDVVYAYFAANGELRWSYTTGGPVSSTPVVANNTVYVGSNDDKIYALDATGGAVDWTYSTPNKVYGSPVVANGIVYATSSYGTVYALAASYGGVLWQGTTGYTIQGSPVVADGRLIVAADALYDFELTSTPTAATATPKISQLRPNTHLRVTT